MTQKTCGGCRQDKPLTEFNRKASRPDGRQEVCRDCNRASSRRYYAANRERHIEVIGARTRRQRTESKRFLAEYLRDHACVDCGNADLRVLDFDHRPGSVKRGEVMQLVKDGFSLATIRDELSKCDVRCRNCHAIVTLERSGDNWRSRAMRAKD